MTETGSRANSIFGLGELLSPEATQPSALGKEQTVKGTIPLTPDGKRVLAYTAREANRLRDYWIDSEHLVIGIVREGESPAAARLHAIGLDLETSRQRVIENKSSRPARPNPVLWWAQRRPLGLVLEIAFLLGVVLALILLGFGGAN